MSSSSFSYSLKTRLTLEDWSVHKLRQAQWKWSRLHQLELPLLEVDMPAMRSACSLLNWSSQMGKLRRLQGRFSKAHTQKMLMHIRMPPTCDRQPLVCTCTYSSCESVRVNFRLNYEANLFIHVSFGIDLSRSIKQWKIAFQNTEYWFRLDTATIVTSNSSWPGGQPGKMQQSGDREAHTSRVTPTPMAKSE